MVPVETLAVAQADSRGVMESLGTAGVVVADTDLRIVHLNGTIFAGHGLAPDDWRGKLLSEVLPPDASAQLEPRYRSALSGETQSFQY
jgi:PAS domain-containing protein